MSRDPPSPDPPNTWASIDPHQTWSEDQEASTGPFLPGNERVEVRETEGRYGPERKELGRGGLGRVVARWDHALEREVALKELLGDVSGNQALFRRFLREARITAALEHPGIVPVYELGVREDGSHYYTMRRIHGRTLADVLGRCDTTVERLALLESFETACLAVAYAHSRGVVHRDLKPSNVMVGGFGETIVLDWGIAKARGSAIDREDLEPTPAPAGNDTRLGTVLGTPAYMSPEQADGALDRVDERSDVYSLGVILFELLVGIPAFRGPTEMILESVRSPSRPRVRDHAPDIPLDLAAIAEKAMRHDPADRYATAGELAEEIQRFRRGARVGAYRYGPLEQLAKWVGRNRLATTVFASAAVTLAVGAVGAGLDMRVQRNAAVLAREDANARRDLAQGRLAAAYEDQAARALLDGDPATAELYAAGALEIAERPLARGTLLGARRTWTPLLSGQLELAPRCRHIAWNPAGDLLASCGAAGEVLAHELDRGQIAWRQSNDATAANRLAWSRDGHALAVAHRSGAIEIWGADGAPIAVAPTIDDLVPYGLAWLPDGRLAVGGAPFSAGARGVHLLDVARNQWTGDFPTGDTEIWALDASPDGRWLAAGVQSRLVVWDVSTGERRIDEGGHDEGAMAVAFSPDGRTIAVGTGSSRVALHAFDPEDPSHTTLLATLEGHRGAVESLAWNPAGDLLFSGAEDGTVRVWSVAGRPFAAAALPRAEGWGAEVAVDPDGDTAAIRGAGPLRTWAIADVPGRARPWALGAEVRDLAFSPDGARVAAVDGDNSLWWSAPAAVPAQANGLLAEGVAWVGDQPWLWDRSEHTLWAPDHGGWTRMLPVDSCVRRSAGGASVLCLDAEGVVSRIEGPGQISVVWRGTPTTRLAGQTRDGCVEVVSGQEAIRIDADGNEIWRSTLVSTPGELVVASPSGTWVATAFDDGTVALLGGDEEIRLQGHTGTVSDLAFTPDGALLASASFDRTVRLWSVPDGAEVARLPHPDRVTQVAISPDGATLATGGWDHRVRWWALDALDIPGPAARSEAERSFGVMLESPR